MTTHDDNRALEEIRTQRADLWNQLVGLERAIATPLPGRVEEWAGGVHEALVELSATFERHCAMVEAPGGLFAEVLEAAPRLGSMVTRLRDEHVEISDQLRTELRDVRELAKGGTVDEAVTVRDRLTALLGLLSRHRQGGADLVYEAYAVDIGVGD